eukprot:m.31055 g.31055  ORF g.31055 m.31055 type:complete len:70 (-) comp12027_c0_seq1:1060-1269(-)
MQQAASSSGIHELNQTLAMLALPPPAQLRALINPSLPPASEPTTSQVEEGQASVSGSFFLTEMTAEGSC